MAITCDAVCGCGVGGAIGAMALVYLGGLDLIAGDDLRSVGGASDFSVVSTAGKDGMRRGPVPWRVHRHVDCRSLLAFPTVTGCTLTVLGHSVQRPAIYDHSCWFCRALGRNLSTERRSTTITLKQPAASQRRASCPPTPRATPCRRYFRLAGMLYEMTRSRHFFDFL